MGLAPDLEARVGAVLETCAKWLALSGGVLLAGLALLTVSSVLGRAFIFIGLGPIKGDYELVEMGCAIAVFSFLPWCQLKRGHVTVDIVVDTLVMPVGALGDAGRHARFAVGAPSLPFDAAVEIDAVIELA